MLKLNKKALAASLLSLTLLLSACGGNDSGGGKLDKVQVDLKNSTAEPEVTFDKPFSADGNLSRIVEEGNGESIEDGDYILIEDVAYNGENGEVIRQSSTYTKHPVAVPVDENLKKSNPDIYETLKKMKVGGTALFSSNLDPRKQQQQQGQGQDPAAQPTLPPGTATPVEAVTIKSKLPKYASGQAQPEDSKLPKFTLDENTGKAELKLPENKGEDPKELVTKDLIVGNGRKVEANDTLYVKFIGVKWSDGSVFDGNYSTEGKPTSQPIASMPLRGLLEGWKKGLPGKTVGSRVELVIPAEMAYEKPGETPSPQNPKGPLVFVVDILDAQTDHTPQEEYDKRKQQQEQAQKKIQEQQASGGANPANPDAAGQGSGQPSAPVPSATAGGQSAESKPAESKPSESAR